MRKLRRGCIWFLVILIILALALMPFLTGGVSAQSLQGGASLEVSFIQSFNHVDFTVSWVTDDPNGEWYFLFGDGTETVLVGATGTANFSHDYAYEIDGVITYYPSIDLPSDGGSGSWTDPWQGTVVIDDRSIEVTYIVYLPIVMKAAPSPHCSVLMTEQNVNHVVFDVVWENAGSGNHTISFGDGTGTQQFSGENGSGQTWHDYSYPGGNFIISMDLSGGGNCFTKVLINWP